VVDLLNLVIVVFAMDQGEGRTQRSPLGPARFQNQRLHLGLALANPLQIVVKQQDFARLQLLDRMQPAEIDQRLSDQHDESHAVRSGDEFRAQFDHLTVYKHLGLL